MHKGDECALINNSQPYKWKVLNRSGDEALVPSVCFLVPPVNKEAVESVSRYVIQYTLSNVKTSFKVIIHYRMFFINYFQVVYPDSKTFGTH